MLRATSDGVTLAVRAQPGAKKTAITGIYGDGASAQLKIAVHAPPIEGRANEGLIAFLAETFSLPRSAIQLISGEHSRSKIFLLRGATRESVRRTADAVAVSSSGELPARERSLNGVNKPR